MPFVEAVPAKVWESPDVDEHGLIVLGQDLNVVLWNRTLENISSIPAHKAVGQRIDTVFPGMAEAGITEIITRTIRTGQRQLLRLSPETPLFSNNPLQAGVSLVVIDPVSSSKGFTGAVMTLQFKKKKTPHIDARMILDGLADAVISFDEKGNVESFNVTAEKIFGDRCNEVIGRTISRLIPELGLFITGLGKISLEQRWEVNGVRKNGDVFPIDLALSKIEHEGKQLFIVVGSDITDRRKATEHMRRLAHYDALTGLANRLLLEERLHQALAHAKRSGGKVAVLMLDLDRFKEVNDTYGHHTGDMLLREISRRLTVTTRETDTVARLGGDEFVVVLTGLSEGAAAAGIADFLLQEIARPVIIEQAEIHPATSIGISVFPDDSVDMEQLIKNADMALYRSKSGGRGTYHFYVSDMDDEVQSRKMMERDLRKAIDERDDTQLKLYFQPLINLSEGTVSGAEVLMRWRHPTDGFIPPSQFLPAVERTDSIVQLGQWIFDQACHALLRWRERSDSPSLRLALNLSQAQFKHPDLFNMVRETLESHGVAPSSLQLEVTETVAMNNIAASGALLKKLRELGVSVSIDDYGTGYSSLRHLQSLPMDKLKIDQSFLTGIETQPDQAAMVQAIVNLGHTIGVAVNVEGVETTGQLALLRRFYVDEVQGYLFSPPLPENEFLDYVLNPPLDTLRQQR